MSPRSQSASTLPNRRALLKFSLLGLAGAAVPVLPSAFAAVQGSINERMRGDISPVHDPCIIREGDTYYVFCTTMPDDGAAQISFRTSKDLVTWTKIGDVFPAVPAWAKKEIPDVRALWAPDITFYKGRYWLYYAASSFGTNVSVIGLATNKTLDPKSPHYKWEDHGAVIRSTLRDDYNCIDPAHVIDREGRSWLAFGSFWSGIKLVELDPQTGNPVSAKPHLYSLAARPTPEGGLDTIEAPFIIERGGYYYLFASYDYCCKGVNSTYYTAMGRAKDITGPYLDCKGRKMLDGYGSVILKADQQEKGRWRGPGHCAILRDPGQDYIVYHAYDKLHHGAPYLRIAPIVWSKGGWPSAKI